MFYVLDSGQALWAYYKGNQEKPYKIVKGA